jgi:SdrD B-like domain
MWNTTAHAEPRILTDLNGFETIDFDPDGNSPLSVTTGNTLLFRMKRAGQNTEDLFRSDGTRDGTFRVASNFKRVRFLQTIGKDQFFITGTGTGAGTFDSLWVTQGTGRSTKRVLTFPSGRFDGSAIHTGPRIANPARNGEQLYIAVGGSLFASAGTTETSGAANFFGTTATTNVAGLRSISGRLFLLATQGSTRSIFGTGDSPRTLGSASVISGLPANTSDLGLLYRLGSSGLMVPLKQAGGDVLPYNLVSNSTGLFLQPMRALGTLFETGPTLFSATPNDNGGVYMAVGERGSNGNAGTRRYLFVTESGVLDVARDGRVNTFPNDRLFFSGRDVFATAFDGKSLYRINDGRGVLVEQTDSVQFAPDNFATINGRQVFVAETPADGRELRFNPLTNNVHGYAYVDRNGNSLVDADETVAGQAVFVDANNNRQFDQGETTATTDVLGFYSLTVSNQASTVNIRMSTKFGNDLYPASSRNDTTGFTHNVAVNSTLSGYRRDFPMGDRPRVTGVVFVDNNSNGIRDEGEPGVAGAIVYLDPNNNDQIDFTDTNNNGFFDSEYDSPPAAPEFWVRTTAEGNYSLGVAQGGTYAVRIYSPFQAPVTLEQSFTLPQTNLGIRNRDWAVSPTRRVPGLTGTIFRDSDLDGVRDVGESPRAGITVYLDTNNNNVLDTFEVRVLSDAQGRYELPAGKTGVSYVARVLFNSNDRVTTPASFTFSLRTITSQREFNFGGLPRRS